MIDPPIMTDQWHGPRKMVDRGGHYYTKDLLPARVTISFLNVTIEVTCRQLLNETRHPRNDIRMLYEILGYRYIS